VVTLVRRPRGKNALPILVAAVLGMAGVARAGIWATEPVVGLQGEYSSNPDLLTDVGRTNEAHGAVLLDAPTTYQANDMSLSIQPSFRIANSSGYSSLASDYAHLNTVGQLNFVRDTLTATAQLDRDSSLYHDYLVNGSTGVRRDTTVADLAWNHALTERLAFNLDTNSSRVVYAQSSSFGTLTDYRYTSSQPSLSWTSSERTTFSLLGGAGLYQSSDGAARSVNDSVQLGFSRQLDELWKLSASAGYSHEYNKVSQDVPFLFVIDGMLFEGFRYETFRSSQNGSVFSASLNRQAERWQYSATASRSLTPSGFALLSTLEAYEMASHFACTERWSLEGHVRRVKSLEPQVEGPAISETYLTLGMSAAWLVTEKWTLTMAASWVKVDYRQPNLVNVDATGVSVNLARHFDRIEWD